MKYLIVIDIDGTLINDDGIIPQKNKEIIEKLTQDGHYVVIATGRPYHASFKLYEELKLTTPIITDNGGNIRIPSNPNFKMITDGIPVDIAHDIFNFTKSHLESAFFSYGDYLYSYKHLDRLHAIFKGGENAKIIHASFDELELEPTGMIYLVNIAYKIPFENKLMSLSEKIHFRLWGEDRKHAIYEIYKANTSKYSAIEWVMNYLNVDKEHVIAFGDGLNDIEMIGNVHLGVAMPNGEEMLKQVAKTIAPFDNDNAGVGYFLENYFYKK